MGAKRTTITVHRSEEILPSESQLAAAAAGGARSFVRQGTSVSSEGDIAGAANAAAAGGAGGDPAAAEGGGGDGERGEIPTQVKEGNTGRLRCPNAPRVQRLKTQSWFRQSTEGGRG